MTEILDFVVIFLLTIAIIYGFMLNRKINLIHESKKELANLFKSFDNTIVQAQKGIEELKVASGSASIELQKRIDKAEILIDDIKFLNQKSLEIGKRLDRATTNPAKSDVSYDTKTLTPEQVKMLKKKNSNKDDSGKANNAKAKKREKALEGLLEKLAEKRNDIQSIESEEPLEMSTVSASSKSKKKDEMSVADVLKSLGYGE